jgi:hypothetical protein
VGKELSKKRYLERFKTTGLSPGGLFAVSSSIILTGIGFLIAWLGVIMVYLSLRVEPADLNRRHMGFLGRPFVTMNESRKAIKLLIVIGILVTAALYAASWVGLIAW